MIFQIWEGLDEKYALKSDISVPVDFLNYVLKTEISLSVQSGKILCDATAAISSLAYVVNSNKTQTVTNSLLKQVSVCEWQITALE